MSLSRGTALLAALGLVTGAIGLAAAQQPETPRRPTVQNEQPDPTQPRTPRQPGTPRQPADPGTPRQPAEPGTPATPADPASPVQGNSFGFVRASQIVGVEVMTGDGQHIGVMADLLVSTPSGTGHMGSGIFAFISVDAAASGRVAVIPWELFRYENGVFILAFDVSRLNDVPSVMQDDPRLLQNQEWLGQVNEFFADDLRRIQRARPDLDNGTPDGPATPDTLGPPTTAPGTPETPNPRTPNPRTPNPRTPNTGTSPQQPGNTPAPAPRTSQPGAATNPNP
jgi:hypothetical protein